MGRTLYFALGHRAAEGLRGRSLKATLAFSCYSLLWHDVLGKYIENENRRTASFREHRAAACRTTANANFECPLSPIPITGETSS